MKRELSAIDKCVLEVWKREKAYIAALDESTTAEHAYKIGYAKAYLKADGSIQAREAQAVIETDELLLNHLRAKATVAGMKVKVEDAQDVLSARQSLLSASAKADFHHANSRGTT